VVFTHLELPQEVRNVCEELGLRIVEGGGALQAYMRDHGIEEYLGSELTVGMDDPHPTALAHRILAEVLYDDLEREGVLDSLRAEALDRTTDPPRVAAAGSRSPAAQAPLDCPDPDQR
jgi:hypothetical protein